jgi:SNF2 family DNA or RNA helicase
VKSDSNLIFSRLKTLNAVHRILLTGTPLNNNLRELFNLLNFLDPVNFKYFSFFSYQGTSLTARGLNDLEEKFFHLNENLLAELHAMIQPYILRRIKADVLRLPPKVS